MAYEPAVVLYDANVLYPFHLRNLLLQCAVDRLVVARWSKAIHDEWIRNLVERHPTVTRERLERTRDLMDRVLPEAAIAGYERHIPSLDLPDADDRHVLAAAIEAGAAIIVTANIRDFPAHALRPHAVRAQHPNDILLRLLADIPDVLLAALRNARRNLSRSKPTSSEFIEALERQGLVRFGQALRTRDEPI